ncbi:MAG: cytochrome C [Myxococcales bacterium]|nr:cytochrome C [Myxococcales bacterium]MDH5307833.1 cytochrome C [Myxococcales bacterium]MDH5566243.1 cytochrome C [Myxococcales bacterium]
MEREKRLYLLAFFAALFAAVAGTPVAVSGAVDFKLKEGARGKVCLECHETFAGILKKRFVHTPLAKGNCVGCHSPHTSDHAKLLLADRGEMCAECHAEVVPSGALSAHKVVIDGECTSCHDAHASNNRMNLLQPGKTLCFECHAELSAKIAKNEFAHAPVSKDCLQCHTPHASVKSPKLLKAEVPTLCLGCHKTDTASFGQRHKGYPVGKARCTTCHDPHGSSRKGILFDNVHKPVADKKCDECHEGAGSKVPFALKDEGYELCEGCHYEKVADAFNAKRIHWAVVDHTGCINCHAPHASAEDGLLKAPMSEVCGECHADTVARQERSQTKHPPIAEGECDACHAPHGSESVFLLNEPSVIEQCATCHDWQVHSTHPIGEKVEDPRNQNVRLQCLSCHRTHGTEYEHFLYFETTNEMCVQCHSGYRR